MAKFQYRYFGEIDRARTPGLTLWAYRDIAAALADIMAVGFFDPADHQLTVGDHIIVSGADGAAYLWVRANEGGRVVVDVLGRTA